MTTWQVLLAGAIGVYSLMTIVWAIGVRRRDASLVDRIWGLAFVVQAWIYAIVGGGDGARETLMVALVTIWGLRLSGYITYRNWGDGEDPRYVAMRERNGDNWNLVNLVKVFWLQGTLSLLIGVPLLAVSTRATPVGLTWLDAVAAAVWVVGFVFEAGGDLQLQQFLADSSNRGKVLSTGLWTYTRHPNYFGDTVQWMAYSLLGIATGAWWSIAGYLLMTLFIVKVSGVALTDKNMTASPSRREGHDEYVRRTNAFFPGPLSD